MVWTAANATRLAPKYDELGELFKPHSGKVVIAKVDATANDVPDEIQGFPTLKLFPAKNKLAPIEYSGAREVDDLAKFIQDNGSFSVDPESDADEADDEPTSSTTSGGIKSKLSEAAEAAATALLDSDGDQLDHDEL